MLKNAPILLEQSKALNRKDAENRAAKAAATKAATAKATKAGRK